VKKGVSDAETQTDPDPFVIHLEEEKTRLEQEKQELNQQLNELNQQAQIDKEI